jgi:predicted DCC family thiol-disulfide oxidoreductase YuxK
MQTTVTTMRIGEPEHLGAAAAGTHAGRPVLLYSGSCRFCRWAARTVAALDRGQQLAILPLADEEAGRLLDAVPESRRTESWWVVRCDGIPDASKRGAGIVLITEIRLTRPLGRGLRTIGLSRLVDALDALVARHRGRLSRLVPDGPAPRRYP